MVRLLLVEDELEIQSFVKQSLIDAGYEVHAAEDGNTAALLAAKHVYHGMIVDLGLPDRDGIDLILQLRKSGVTSPVLILSARRSVDDRVKGLELGGDDYLTKPFAIAELLARLRNLLRRNSPQTEDATRLRVRDLELDMLKRRATRGDEVLNLQSAGVRLTGVPLPPCGQNCDPFHAVDRGLGHADSARHKCGRCSHLSSSRQD